MRMCKGWQTEVCVVQGGGGSQVADLAPQLSVGTLFLTSAMDFDFEQVNAATRLVKSAERAVGYGNGIMPTNGDEWRHRFLAGWDAGRPVNPQFEYRAARGRAAQAIDIAWAALPDHHQWRVVLARELERLAYGLRALVTRDPVQQTDYARQQFDVPTATDRANAERYLEAHRAESVTPAASVNSEVVIAIVRTVLAAAGLDDWTVEGHEHMAARMSVAGRRRLVRVRRDAMFSPTEVRRLLVHEIGTHLLRSANGQRQPLAILGYGITGYLATEEGLAVWHEQQSGVADINVMRRYALRVIACHTALTGDFCAVFETLRPYASPDEAFTMALRVKRGLLDTGAPGGYIKDHVYLTGAQATGAHLEQHPEDHELLLATKWPLTEVETLRSWHRAGLVRGPAFRPASLMELIDASIPETA